MCSSSVVGRQQRIRRMVGCAVTEMTDLYNKKESQKSKAKKAKKIRTPK